MQSLVERYNNREVNDILRSEVYEEMAEALTNLIWDVHKEFSAGAEIGIDFEEKAFYDILMELCIKYDFKYNVWVSARTGCFYLIHLLY